jgi:hypothetical protein
MSTTAAIKLEISDLLHNRKCYLERKGWTYILRRQGPNSTVEFKIGRTVNLDKRLSAYTKCGGIYAVRAWYTRCPKKIGESSEFFNGSITASAERLIHLELRKRGAWLGRHPCRGRYRGNHQEWFRLSKMVGQRAVEQLVEQCLVRGDRLQRSVRLDFLIH